LCAQAPAQPQTLEPCPQSPLQPQDLLCTQAPLAQPQDLAVVQPHAPCSQPHAESPSACSRMCRATRRAAIEDTGAASKAPVRDAARKRGRECEVRATASAQLQGPEEKENKAVKLSLYLYLNHILAQTHPVPAREPMTARQEPQA
jgi:hypothetical protein